MKLLNAELVLGATNPENGRNSEAEITQNNKPTAESMAQCEGTSLPESWREHLRKRATEPLHTEKPYDRAIADCNAQHEAQLKKKASRYTLSSFEVEPRVIAWGLVVLIFVAGSILLASKVVQAFPGF